MKALGDIGRDNQYNSYITPMSAEEKIEATQKKHKKAQKQINKAMKHMSKALSVYAEANYASEKAIELLAKQKKNMLDLKEEVKKLTYNSLPYKELEEQSVDEREVMGEKTGFLKRLLRRKTKKKKPKTW